MSSLMRVSSIAFLFTSLSTPARLQAAGSAPQWVLDQSGYYCALATKVTGPPDATLVLRTLPGTGAYDFMLVGDRWPASLTGARKQIALTLMPGKASETSAPEGALLDRDRTISIRGLSGRLIREFARSNAVQVAADDRPVVRYALPPAAAAASDALDQCIVSKLIEAGADPAGFEPGATAPKPIGDREKWIDLPALWSMGNGEGVHTAVVLDLDAGGKPTDCNVLELSGRLDRQHVCQALLARARYQPARDPKGRPVNSVVVYETEEIVRVTTTLETFGPE